MVFFRKNNIQVIAFSFLLLVFLSDICLISKPTNEFILAKNSFLIKEGMLNKTIVHFQKAYIVFFQIQ